MYALRMGRRRDSLVIQLAGQLAEAREQNGILAERLRWYQASMPSTPPAPGLRLVEPYAPLRSASRPAL